MRIAIADPPYPPRLRESGSIPRASRWYGDRQQSTKDRPADFHPDAAAWDDPAAHRALLERLERDFDGWAIATTPDGLGAYGDLPAGVRIMAWVKQNGQPGGHRLRGCWEPVIIRTPRPRQAGNGIVSDVLIAGRPQAGFVGAKPRAWVEWVLAALGHEDGDEVTDLFPGTGVVGDVLSQGVLQWRA